MGLPQAAAQQRILRAQTGAPVKSCTISHQARRGSVVGVLIKATCQRLCLIDPEEYIVGTASTDVRANFSSWAPWRR